MKILGISDSRSPGELLINTNSRALCRKFELNWDSDKRYFGYEDQYLFYEDEDAFTKIYDIRYKDIVTKSHEVHAHISSFGLAPKIHEIQINDKCITVKLEKINYNNDSFNTEKLLNKVIELQEMLESFFKTNIKLKTDLDDNTKFLFKLIEENLIIYHKKLNIPETLIREIKSTGNILLQSNGINHGDLHFGNILISGDNFFFTDFESVFHLGVNNIIDFINLSRFIDKTSVYNFIRKQDFKKSIQVDFKIYFNWLVIKNLSVLDHLKQEKNMDISNEFKKFREMLIY